MSAGLEDTSVHRARLYQMDPARFAKFRRSMIVKSAIFAPLMIACIWYLDGRATPRRDLFDFVGTPAILAWTIYRWIQSEREKWDTLLLEFRDGTLVRRLPDFPTLEIAPGEVTKIVESTHGIMIKTSSRRKFLLVSRWLLDYDDFRSRLAVWAPSTEIVRAAPSIPAFIKSSVSVVMCIALFGGPLYLMYTPYHKLIVPLGLGLVVGLAAMTLYYYRSPNVPISFRKAGWILPALPLLAMISRLL